MNNSITQHDWQRYFAGLGRETVNPIRCALILVKEDEKPQISEVQAFHGSPEKLIKIGEILVPTLLKEGEHLIVIDSAHRWKEVWRGSWKPEDHYRPPQPYRSFSGAPDAGIY